MTEKECIETYGPIDMGEWADAVAHCSTYPVPNEIAPTWINSATGAPTTHIYCNNDLRVCLSDALKNVIARGLVAQLKTFDGCFEVRAIRGASGFLSAHSWAMAIDINAATNELGTSGDMSDELATCFTDVGFVWGKTFSRQDPMHMSATGF